jgi:endonuclease YncB( thermonuclease family)
MGKVLPFRRRRRRPPVALFGLLGLGLVGAGLISPPPADMILQARADGQRPDIVDGDTLHLGDEKIRLFGIDAPEIDQTCGSGAGTWDCGKWSARMLADIAGGGVTCQGNDRDRYGRLLATCHAGGQDVAEAMVAAGAAVAYVRYSDAYLAIEDFARAKEAGIWGGAMQAPEDFRHAETAPAPSKITGDCVIKGNISGNGRIYHVPGQENYDDTRISVSRGERWFCSAAEAEAAGWRAARN